MQSFINSFLTRRLVVVPIFHFTKNPIEYLSNKKIINQHKIQPLTMISFYDFDHYLFELQSKMNLFNGPSHNVLSSNLSYLCTKNRENWPKQNERTQEYETNVHIFVSSFSLWFFFKSVQLLVMWSIKMNSFWFFFHRHLCTHRYLVKKNGDA